MKILFLTPQLPYPPNSGGTIKSFKLIEFLSNTYDVGCVCLLKNQDELFLKEFLKKVHLNLIDTHKLNKARTIGNLVRSYFNRIPLSIYRNNNEQLKKNILTYINNYDVLIIDHFLMFQYIPDSFKGKIILHEHNAEYIMWNKASINESSYIKKFIIKLETYRIKKYETKIINKSNAVLAAPNDILNLTKLSNFNCRFYETLHLGDEQLLNKDAISFSNTELSLLYIGTLSWEANIDGLIWFIDSCWEQLKIKYTNLKLYIVGSNPPDSLQKRILTNEDIILTGFVDDLEKYYSKSRVFISPLRFGSGIKVKNINAMYRGIPLVTTSVGAESIDSKDMIHLAIADNKEDFIEKIEKLLVDENLWLLLQKNSRELMKEKYTWDIVFKNLKRAINE